MLAALVSIGMSYGCVIDNGDLQCWGGGFSPLPTTILSHVKGVAASQGNVCAFTEAGVVSCNNRGTMKPIGIDDAVEIATDSDAFLTCMRRRDNTVACWSSITEAAPIAMPGLEGALEIAVAGDTVCARDADGVVCSTLGEARGARRIARAKTAVHLVAGHFRFAAILANHTTLGWTEADKSVSLPAFPKDATDLALADHQVCALTPAAVVCWRDGAKPHAIPNTAHADELAIGDTLACVRQGAHTSCWGDIGELGEPDFITDHAVDAVNLTDAVKIQVTGETSCAERKTGKTVCWGRRGSTNTYDSAPTPRDSQLHDCSHNECGRGVTRAWSGYWQRGSWTCKRALHTKCEMTFAEHGGGSSRGPEQGWGDLDHVRDIRMPENQPYACLVLEDGHVKCFNPFEGVANAETIKDVSDVIAIAGNGSDTCAVERGGSVKCWPEGGAVRTMRGVDDAIGISAGDVSTCALRKSGKVSCWGFRALLGDDVDRFRSTPKQIK
ncbi:MAG: hypothetical protein QM831_36515 [Kofleriaceae bacterium]